MSAQEYPIGVTVTNITNHDSRFTIHDSTSEIQSAGFTFYDRVENMIDPDASYLLISCDSIDASGSIEQCTDALAIARLNPTIAQYHSYAALRAKAMGHTIVIGSSNGIEPIVRFCYSLYYLAAQLFGSTDGFKLARTIRRQQNSHIAFKL